MFVFYIYIYYSYLSVIVWLVPFFWDSLELNPHNLGWGLHLRRLRWGLTRDCWTTRLVEKIVTLHGTNIQSQIYVLLQGSLIGNFLSQLFLVCVSHHCVLQSHVRRFNNSNKIALMLKFLNLNMYFFNKIQNIASYFIHDNRLKIKNT